MLIGYFVNNLHANIKHAYIQTNPHTNKPTYKQTHIQTNTHTNKHTYKLTYSHTYTHINKQTPMYTKI